MEDIERYIKCLAFPEHSFKALPSHYFPYPYSSVVDDIKKMYADTKTVDLSILKYGVMNGIRARKVQKSSFKAYEKAVRDKYAKTVVDDAINNIPSSVDPSFFSSLSMKLNSILNDGDRAMTTEDLVQESMDLLKDRVERHLNNIPIGIPTPVRSLTDFLYGWQPRYYIIAARPSIGKTSFAMSCVNKACLSGYNTVVFSLEMSRSRIMDKLVLMNAPFVKSSAYMTGNLNEDEVKSIYKSCTVFSNYNIIIDDFSGATADYIYNKTLQYKNEGRCDMVVIDYVQLVKGMGDDNAKITATSNRLKDLSKDADIPVVALAQINREAEASSDKKPKIHHMKGSGSLEQDADVVILLHRPEHYGIMQDDDCNSTVGRMELYIPKNRDGSTKPENPVKCYHDSNMVCFSDVPFEDVKPKEIQTSTASQIDFSKLENGIPF